MINRILIIIISVVFGSFVLSCQPENVKPVGDPLNKTELFNGSWIIEKVIQIDVDAAQKGFPMEVQQIDITSIFPNNPFTDLSLQFNATAMTFEVSKGTSFSSWPASGTWELDSPNYPSKVMLYTLTDTLSLSISNLSGIIQTPATITFRETKQKAAGANFVDAIYYDYSFTKQ